MAKRENPREKVKKVKEEHSLTQEETNSLERMIEKDKDNVSSSEIKEVLREQRIEKASPSLNKINAPQKIPTRLEKDLTESTILNNNSGENEDDPFKYSPGEKRQGGESKYVKYEGMIIENRIPRTEIQNIGKGNSLERREVSFENSPQAKMTIQENFERYVPPPVKRTEKEKLGKEKPSERREIKYTPERY
jgi:hypothetical protein